MMRVSTVESTSLKGLETEVNNTLSKIGEGDLETKVESVIFLRNEASSVYAALITWWIED